MPRPTHFEIHAQDPARAIAFYEGLFGWTFTPFGPPGQYWFVKTGDGGPGIDGGLLPRRGAAPKGGEPVIAWVCTCDVDDVDAYVAKALEMNGEVGVHKMAIPGVGWLAYVHDTEGNIIGLMQPDEAAA